MSDKTEKLTKKQRKALEFRKKKSGASTDVSDEKEFISTDEPKSKDRKAENELKKRKIDDDKAEEPATDEEPTKKKRKTRRGKKGKGLGDNKRFILFVGNLPYNTTQQDLEELFKSCKPDVIRIRPDKGIAFVEFRSHESLAAATENGTTLRSRMDVALSKHHSIFKNRKINVELTAGGGGNSKNRMEKIKEKNMKLLEERRQKIIKQDQAQRKKKAESNKQASSQQQDGSSSGIHPSRLALMKHD